VNLTAPRRTRDPYVWKAMAACAAIADDPPMHLGWLEVECLRCNTRASLPFDAIRRPRDTPIWKLEASLKCLLSQRSICAAGAYD
jgi:hypothetical protein